MYKYYRPKEISWLSFNHRVLQQSLRKDVPFYEKIKFLGIYSNNMDEFFRVRVATLKRLLKLRKKSKIILGYDPNEVLQRINKIVKKQSFLAQKAFEKLIDEMYTKFHVKIVDVDELKNEDYLYVQQYFYKQIYDALAPIMINEKTQNLNLIDDNIYFGIKFTSRQTKQTYYAILQLPTDRFPRFIILPNKLIYTKIIYLDDIIRHFLPAIFKFYDPINVKAYTFKITKDAELDIYDDIESSYLEVVEESLKKRKKGRPVRFVYDQQMSKDILDLLLKIFKISNRDTIIAGGRYHNTKDLMHFPNVFGPEHCYTKLEPIKISAFEENHDYFSLLKQKDILLYYPYHSFSYFIQFLRQASIDPYVKSITITIYRVAKNSNVINLLLNAINNGKQVTAIIELQARFDESDNIKWSKILAEAGAKVIYGVRGLKVHAKICQIKRVINNEVELYCSLGTGNHNEDTAKIYTDFMYMTARPEINNEVENLIDFIENNYKHYTFNHLLVSPFNTRQTIVQLIEKEINNAKLGKKAFIYIKINNIDDYQIIQKLYEANKAGVEIVLLVRGMFSLITQIKDISDKIEAYGIIDMFLEHSRLFIFCNNNNPLFYISSADFMYRNLDKRVEVSVPIYDEKFKQILWDIFQIIRKDNYASRILDKKLKNKLNRTKDSAIWRSQIEVYKYLKKIDY